MYQRCCEDGWELLDPPDEHNKEWTIGIRKEYGAVNDSPVKYCPCCGRELSELKRIK